MLSWLGQQRAVWRFLPAGLILALMLIWIGADGGYFSQAWYPSALGLVALLAVTLTAGPEILPPQRPARIALLAFATLVAFNYLSILWAGSQGSALQASNKLLLYLVAAWTIAVLPWTPRALAVMLVAWSIGVALICAVGLIDAVGSAHLDPFFVESRYAQPMKYPNATAALAAMALWPALVFSARRQVPAWLQLVLLPTSVFLADFALLPQSRAAVLGTVAAALVAIVLINDRLRVLLRVGVVGLSLAIVVPRTLDVDRAANSGRHVAPLLHKAALAILLCTLGAAVAAALLALAERNLGPAVAERWARQRRARAVSLDRRRLLGVLGGLVVLVAVLVALTAGAIGRAASSEWRGISGGKGARLLSTTPEERLDYLRVGLRLFRDSPVGGVGAGNFGSHYDAMRRKPKHSQYTHNLTLRALSETGVVGFALFVTIVVALAMAGVAAARRSDGAGRACAVVALAIACYFLVHDSLDWMDEFPALAVPALAFPLAASATTHGRQRCPSVAAYRRIAAVGAFVVAAAVVLTPAYLSSRYVRRAYASYRVNPTRAFDDLRRAAALNPLAIEPYTAKGTIAVNLGQPGAARTAFTDALKREDSWYPRLELALLDAQSGQFASARQAVDRAAALDADDPIIREAREMIDRRQRIDPVRFNQVSATDPQFTILKTQVIK